MINNHSKKRIYHEKMGYRVDDTRIKHNVLRDSYQENNILHASCYITDEACVEILMTWDFSLLT